MKKDIKTIGPGIKWREATNHRDWWHNLYLRTWFLRPKPREEEDMEITILDFFSKT